MIYGYLSKLLPFLPDVSLDMSVPQPPEPLEGQVWCPNRLCSTWREYFVIPAVEATKLYGEIPPFHFCVWCGEQVDLPEEAA